MLVIGLISGTSVDAIDAALVEIDRAGTTLYVTLHAFAMYPFDETLRNRVRQLLPPHVGSTVDVCEVNVLLGEAFAQAVQAIAPRAGLSTAQLGLIASHGQTVYHQVSPGSVRSTLQLGDPAIIAERCGSTVVSDFRPRDIAAGGEGAPLVPYLDQLLLSDPERYRAVQNIGGIGNVTYLPPSEGDSKELPLQAFDTGPGNVLIDEAVRLLTGGQATFDRDGRMAAAGTVDEELLSEWLAHPFFRQPPPKSTGREAWGPEQARRYVEQARAHGLGLNDTLATITALTARSIADAYRRYLGRIDEILVGGGGARNPTLLAMLEAVLPDTPVRTVDDVALDADAKEAIAFAVLGYASLHGWPNNVPAATGARHPVVLGNITPGPNYRALLEQVVSMPRDPPTRIQLGP